MKKYMIANIAASKTNIDHPPPCAACINVNDNIVVE
jgi:hypothetical protein